MKKYVALLVLTLSLGAFARADEIEFATLPQPIQTTVIRETHIPSASAVTRVIRQDGGFYAVTVRQDEGTRVVYVNESGTIVQAPGSTEQRLRPSRQSNRSSPLSRCSKTCRATS